MHEMGIALQIINVVTSSVPKEMTDTKVEKINIRIGKMSAVISENLRYCFDIAVKDTPLDGATLDITEIPVTAECIQCNNKWTVTQPSFLCPKCESGDVQLLSGRELDIVSLEMAE